MRDRNHTNRGFSIIELLIAMAVMIVVVSIGLLILGLNPTKAGNEAAAISAVRTLVTAERIYRSTTGDGRFGNLGELRAASLIDARLALGSKHGYSFMVTKQEDGYTITANPSSDWSGRRSFFADDSGIIRARPGTGASAEDPPLGE